MNANRGSGSGAALHRFQEDFSERKRHLGDERTSLLQWIAIALDFGCPVIYSGGFFIPRNRG